MMELVVLAPVLVVVGAFGIAMVELPKTVTSPIRTSAPADDCTPTVFIVEVSPTSARSTSAPSPQKPGPGEPRYSRKGSGKDR